MSISWRVRLIAMGGGISVYPALPREKQAMEMTEYGERILATLSQERVGEFGRGFDVTNLTRMMKFAGASGFTGSISWTPSVAGHLPADRRGGSLQISGYLTNRRFGSNAS
jgi:hypothetical protein